MVRLAPASRSARWSAIWLCIRQPKRHACTYRVLGVAHMELHVGTKVVIVHMEIAVGRELCVPHLPISHNRVICCLSSTRARCYTILGKHAMTTSRYATVGNHQRASGRGMGKRGIRHEMRRLPNARCNYSKR